jgi:Tol biopolymer transport system component
LKFDLPIDFVASDMNWSPDGKYFCTTSSHDKQFRVFQVDKASQENIWTVIDLMKHNPNFWKNYPINLIEEKSTSEDQRQKQIVQQEGQRQRVAAQNTLDRTISQENE